MKKLGITIVGISKMEVESNEENTMLEV